MNFKIFATFNNGSIILHRDFKLLEDNYISVAGNDPTPIEDYGEYMLFDSTVTESEAMKKYLSVI